MCEQFTAVTYLHCRGSRSCIPPSVPGAASGTAISDWMLHKTSPVWGANKRLIGQSNSEPRQNGLTSSSTFTNVSQLEPNTSFWYYLLLV